MNGLTSKMKKKFRTVDIRTLHLIVTIVILVLFVQAAGAPSGMGGIGMQSVDSGITIEQCHISAIGLANMSTTALDQLSLNGLDCISSP